MLERIISSGQSSAEQAVLFTAVKFGLRTLGWTSKRDKLISSPTVAFRAKYHLSELPDSDDRLDSIRMNIAGSDGTFILSFGDLQEEAGVMNLCDSLDKPVFKVGPPFAVTTKEISEWIRFYHIQCLNVVSFSNDDVEVFKTTCNIFSLLFRRLCKK